ncbi:MAG: hypothetical protein PUJ75_04015, partial [Bacteroidales bacterium]|nr:hypothetical protein [Bacteroidales bacterium]MDY5788672.1 hypothetical protein [Candidatus Onthomorpha sp.]
SVQSQLITRLPDNLKDRETQFFFQISHSAKLSKIPESKTYQSKNAVFSWQKSDARNLTPLFSCMNANKKLIVSRLSPLLWY